jgi:hypothetical protein
MAAPSDISLSGRLAPSTSASTDFNSSLTSQNMASFTILRKPLPPPSDPASPLAAPAGPSFPQAPGIVNYSQLTPDQFNSRIASEEAQGIFADDDGKPEGAPLTLPEWYDVIKIRSNSKLPLTKESSFIEFELKATSGIEGFKETTKVILDVLIGPEALPAKLPDDLSEKIKMLIKLLPDYESQMKASEKADIATLKDRLGTSELAIAKEKAIQESDGRAVAPSVANTLTSSSSFAEFKKIAENGLKGLRDAVKALFKDPDIWNPAKATDKLKEKIELVLELFSSRIKSGTPLAQSDEADFNSLKQQFQQFPELVHPQPRRPEVNIAILSESTNEADHNGPFIVDRGYESGYYSGGDGDEVNPAALPNVLELKHAPMDKQEFIAGMNEVYEGFTNNKQTLTSDDLTDLADAIIKMKKVMPEGLSQAEKDKIGEMAFATGVPALKKWASEVLNYQGDKQAFIAFVHEVYAEFKNPQKPLTADDLADLEYILRQMKEAMPDRPPLAEQGKIFEMAFATGVPELKDWAKGNLSSRKNEMIPASQSEEVPTEVSLILDKGLRSEIAETPYLTYNRISDTFIELASMAKKDDNVQKELSNSTSPAFAKAEQLYEKLTNVLNENTTLIDNHRDNTSLLKALFEFGFQGIPRNLNH